MELERGHLVHIDGVNDLWFRPDWTNRTVVGVGVDQLGVDPDDFDETADFECINLAREKISRRIPAYSRSVPQGGWAGVITMTPDGHPIFDRLAEPEGLYLAVGDNGTCFKTAPAVGKCFSEWIVDGAPKTVDLRPFRLSRFAEGDPIVGQHQYWDRHYEREFTPSREAAATTP